MVTDGEIPAAGEDVLERLAGARADLGLQVRGALDPAQKELLVMPYVLVLRSTGPRYKHGWCWAWLSFTVARLHRAG